MASNNGGGFRLPAPNREPQANTRPLPEVTDGGIWDLQDAEAIRSSADLRNAGGGGIMSVPLSDDSEGAALVRAHELGHARWTPRNLPDSIVGDFAFQLAEDCRVWQRLASSGVDCSTAIAPPSEWEDRIAENPPAAYLLGVAVATAGTGDGANFREALRAAPEGGEPSADELLRIADAIVDRMRAAGPWPTFADTLEAADCIRGVRPPETETPTGETEPGDGDAPGDAPTDGDGNAGGAGSGEPGDGDAEPGDGGNADGDAEPGDGNGGGKRGDGDADGDADGSGEPADGNGPATEPGSMPTAPPSGGGMRQPPRRPTGAERGAITRRLNDEVKAAAEAKAEAIEREREAAAEGLSLAEREAGEQTAAEIREALRYYMKVTPGKGNPPGTLEVKPVRLPLALPARMRGTAYRSQTYGGRIGNAARVNIDGGLFRNRRMTKGGGTVLVDCSGSMAFTDDDVDAILRAAPAVVIATYNGNDSRGELRIVAARGRRAEAGDLIPPYGGNVVDVPALEWLGKQPSRPRLWVSDGLVTAAGDCFSAFVLSESERLVKRYGIHRVSDVAELLALAETGETVGR